MLILGFRLQGLNKSIKQQTIGAAKAGCQGQT
jgi:hypothetical protein